MPVYVQGHFAGKIAFTNGADHLGNLGSGLHQVGDQLIHTAHAPVPGAFASFQLNAPGKLAFLAYGFCGRREFFYHLLIELDNLIKGIPEFAR
ncbi:hypothetical protein ADICEAN_03984 [Cesiribacter andamanensis AMV16]|uniref:Uncharacterized protein n=1 Tax=Cesiribacter andamanensis AMV16 TaxID=1279009 RepID=M7NQX4_9BACT|nr:hypothetical protein ADICEAN_03984 [Cesiribacter andamanensis AMV16]